MADRSQAAGDEARRLLNIVIEAPSRITSLPEAELDLALRVARRARLLGRLACDLEAAGCMDALPGTVVDQLISARIMADARVRLAFWELDRISWALEGADVASPILMKGCTYVLLGLPNARGRLFADVDLMTAEKQLEEVENHLNARGWRTTKLTPYDQNYYRNWTHELPPLVHAEREVEIDLHHNILPRTARLKPQSGKLLERSRQLEGSSYRVLCDEDVLLHAMTHLMFDADLDDKIRDLVDIHDLIVHFSAASAGFWPAWQARAAELDLTRPAYYALRYCHRLLNTTVPESVLREVAAWAPPRPILKLMDELVPRALYPQHPDAPQRVNAVARLLLYVRSHWIRMPPWLLAYHLTYKFFVTRIMRAPDPSRE